MSPGSCWGVYWLWLLAQVGENKGGSPERGPPVDFELLFWLLKHGAGVFNQIAGDGCFGADAVCMDCGQGARVRKLISHRAAGAYSPTQALLVKRWLALHFKPTIKIYK